MSRKTHYVVLLILCLSLSAKAQEVTSYNLSVNIDIKQHKVHVDGSMKVDFKQKDTIVLALWKQTTIHAIKGSRTNIAFRFDTIAPSPMFYAPNGRALTLTKKIGTPALQTININYDCYMKGLDRWAQTFLDEWVELNMYSAWFPLNNASKSFTSTIDITMDKAYMVTGSGIISGKDGHWLMKQPWRAYDNVIVASKELKKKQKQTSKSHIELNYNTLKENEADSIFTECQFMFDLYTKLFGPQDSTYFKLAIVPTNEGGGYSRKNFISWRTNHFNFNTRVGLAHEIAHFWWNHANTATWEDWLNEAFADYSKLLYIRERIGDRVFKLNIDFFQKRSKETPPIWSLNRNNEKADIVFYQKGALILYGLSQKVGEEKFFEFLKEVAAKKVNSTNRLLSLVEMRFSKEIREWLEAQLKTA
jgi:Peptidase family M1 domain